MDEFRRMFSSFYTPSSSLLRSLWAPFLSPCLRLGGSPLGIFDLYWGTAGLIQPQPPKNVWATVLATKVASDLGRQGSRESQTSIPGSVLTPLSSDDCVGTEGSSGPCWKTLGHLF